MKSKAYLAPLRQNEKMSQNGKNKETKTSIRYPSQTKNLASWAQCIIEVAFCKRISHKRLATKQLKLNSAKPPSESSPNPSQP